MPLQIPHPSTPLHLYRHLLREATYLPPLCRTWIAERIQSRFRDCRNEKDPKNHIRDAHHDLRYLRSANAGHIKRLLHLCYLATGRVGKRRRLLGKSELSNEPHTSSIELDKARLATDKQREPDWLDNWSEEKIMRLAQSQVENQGGDWPQNMRRQIDPKQVLPTENCFGRPLTKKLARNKLKKHWAGVLHQLLPPLPQGEWDHLGVLARGEADEKHYNLPPRRPVAISNYITPQIEKPTTWIDFVTRPARSIERNNSRRTKSLSGVEDEDPRGHGRAIGTRVINGRVLRELIYKRIWSMSPIIHKNPQTGRPVITWGKIEHTISRPGKKALQFFEGVNNKGVPI
ncbi:uncharacterized protein F4822DRAFT_52355 [Hypoxylon trugodes]|uniref:uncharacterized protein n=1 Tax=Hypoxylon trugodes TaxID=326681 RepID=UPI0021912CF3|nr:uncharacterized protein F4822DRAFT_52355 [Hypoxylon trugodes]KAI1383812.1 hypothetical protein F4822DRAFT_52355 [Hypoxylon trugodes]